MEESPRPILKWAGGKRSIADFIIGLMPESFGTYIEPFLGGGSVFFRLCGRKARHKSVLADINPDLVALYVAVKEKPQDLLQELAGIGYGNNPEDYERAREEYNSLPAGNIRRNALMLYLNRHCYNGLYRVNRNGQFNVPFGRYSKPSLPGKDSIIAISNCLSNATLLISDFQEVIFRAESNDLIYADPPYSPISRSSNFTSYSSNGFNWKDQVRLKEALDLADRKGAFFIISNSWAEEILDLYASYNISRIEANRNINSVANSRGKIPEAVIYNF